MNSTAHTCAIKNSRDEVVQVLHKALMAGLHWDEPPTIRDVLFVEERFMCDLQRQNFIIGKKQ